HGVAGAPELRPGLARRRDPARRARHHARAALRDMRRRARRGGSAQAVLETALIIPLMLLLVCNFLAVMVQVAAQEQMDSAVSLAAQARFQASQLQYDPPATACCPDPRCCAQATDRASLSTAGLPTGCRYAA